MGKASDAANSKANDLLANLFMRVAIGSRMVADPADHKARTSANTDFMEMLEREIAPYAKPIIDDLLESMPGDHPMRPLLEQVGDPEHQVSLIFQLVTIPFALLSWIMGVGKIRAQPYFNATWANSQFMPLSPADLADMVERNIIDQATGEQVAAFSGIKASDFDLLVQDTGEPPGIVDMGKLYLRGELDIEAFQKIVYYSRVRNEWFPQIIESLYNQMSPSDAIELALKQVVDHDTGLALFVRGGGYASDFDSLLSAAGNPIGPEAAANLLAHGLLTQAQFDQIVAHSRINPEFTYAVQLTHSKWLSAYQVGQAIKSGAITAATGQKWLEADGYSADQAAAFTGAGATEAVATGKAETESMILSEYNARLLTASQATAMLAKLGYAGDQITLLLELAEAKAVIAQRNAAVNKVRALYLAGRISKATASSDLDALQIPSQARDGFLTDWSLEIDIKVKTFTPAQVGAFLKKGMIPASDAIQRWTADGYTQEDAALLVQYYTTEKPVAASKTGTS